MVSAGPAPDNLLARANAALDGVFDPELPFLTIRDIGILREVRLAGDGVEIIITPTYSGCPANDIIALEIETAIAKAGIENARVLVVRSPPWTTDWIGPEARAKLAANGIAPPRPSSGKRALFCAETFACPQCGSDDTELVSAFGSTACKSQHRCRACREPFEAFKCI
jgi:ring-1,2-phenylacetyl-CoA epoxidase subunit PaaD